jgi:hypothetical protein
MNIFQKQLLMKDRQTQAEIFNKFIQDRDPMVCWVDNGKLHIFREIDSPPAERKCTMEDFERDMKSIRRA